MSKAVDIPFCRSGVNYHRDTRETALRCEDKSLTQQQFKAETDINTIMERFGVTGELPQGVRMPRYGDFSSIMTYQDACNALRASGEAFMALPGHVRARFDNDCAKFVDFCEDEANRAEAERLGLVREDVKAVSPARQQDGEKGGSAPGEKVG